MNCKKILKLAVLLASVLIPFLANAQDRLLIIAPDEFIDELVPLIRFKNASGRITYLLSLSQVYDNPSFNGADEAEEIKRCIAYYEEHNTVNFVMLVGDSDKFPVRYCRAYNTEWGSKYYPSDLYYADLYDTGGSFDIWDGDGDGIIGEMDFNGGLDINLVNLDNINMYPDVALARVPASDDAEVTTYVNKIIDYELRAPGNWFNNALLVCDDDWGRRTEIENDLVPHLSGFNITRLNHDDYPDPPWSDAQRAAEINTQINSGMGFVNYYGHGNRLEWSHLYYHTFISSLTNQHELPVIFASACYTGRFHFNREYYLDSSNTEWNRTGIDQPKTNYPEPMAVQPSKYDSYDNESLAEHFLVKNNTGGIGYIGCVSKGERGMWLSDPAKSIGLAPYFFEEYDSGNRALGMLWKNALDRFVEDVYDIAMDWYAFIHIHKVILFGDPSLMVGGAFTSTLSGNVYDGISGPLTSYSRYRITENVTVPAAEKLTAYQSASVLFENGKKITAMDTNPTNGLIVNGSLSNPVCFMSLAPDPQSDHVIHGMKVYGQLRMRNGGQIKFF